MLRYSIVALLATACGGVSVGQVDSEQLDSGRLNTSRPLPINEAAGFCPGNYAGSTVPDDVTPTTACPGLRRTDGPVWDAHLGKLFFSNYDVPDSGGFPGGIVEYDPDGGCESAWANAGSNGLTLGTDGRLLAALHQTRTIASVDPTTGAFTNLISSYDGRSFNSTHDLSMSSNGTVYFTDPAFGQESLPEALYYRLPGQGLRSVLLAGRHPKGATLSLDEHRLYVSVAEPDEVLLFDVDDRGMLDNERPFVSDRGSGMTVDCAGSLYLATDDGVHVYGADGTPLGAIAVDVEVTNVAFGGADRRTLFMTTLGALLKLELKVPGAPS
jgi:gluconolactonase